MSEKITVHSFTLIFISLSSTYHYSHFRVYICLQKVLLLDEGLTLSVNKVEGEKSSVAVEKVHSTWTKVIIQTYFFP